MDNGQSVAAAIELEEALKGVNEEVDELGDSAKDLEPFEKELKDIDDKVKSGKLSMREMAKAVKEYQTIAVQAGRTSPVGQEALVKAGALKDELGDLQTEVKNLGTDGANLQAALQLGGTVVAGYSAYQSVVAGLGIENENLQKTMVKLQAAQSALMAIEQIRSSLEKESMLMLKARALQTNIVSAATAIYTTVVGTSTGAMKLFRIALMSTGIGAIIVGIGLLIANFESVSKWVGKVIDYFSNLRNVILALLGPIGWIIMAYEAMGDSAEDAAEREHAARVKVNEEATAAHKAKIAQLEEERAIQQELLAELEDKAKRQTAMNDLEILQARARGASETEIFNITKRQNEENLKLAAEELAAKMKIIEINHQIAEAEYNRWKLFLETQATMSGWTEEQAKRDLERLEQAKANYLEDEAAQIESAQNAFATMEAENQIYLNDRNEQLAQANEKRLEQEKKDMEKRLALEKDYQQELTDMRIGNIQDEEERSFSAMQERHRREREELIAKYGENTELEIELRRRQQSEITALEDQFYQAEFDALEASINAENALKEAQAEIEEAEFQAKLDKAQGYIDAANMALETMTAINDLLNQIGEQRIEDNEQKRDTELSALDKQKNAELAREGLSAQQKAIIERNFAMAEYNIKKKTAEANDKIAKRQFNRNKALQIASAAVNTASAILQGIAQFGPPPSPMGIAAIVSAGVIGGVQIAKIASTRFEGESASISPPDITIPNIGDTGGSGSGGSQNQGQGSQDGPSTLTAGLLEPKLQVSIVEIESVSKTVNQISDIGTI